MFRLDGYELNGVEYIVVDVKADFISQDALNLLASREYGIGADRILLVDMIEGKLAGVVDGLYDERIPTVGDHEICNFYFSGRSDYSIRSAELRLTDYFLQQLITAASIDRKQAC